MKKRRGHYCRVCGQYKANEQFSGKGHAAHICKACHRLPARERDINIMLTRLDNLPWQLSKAQIKWLRKLTQDERAEVRAEAQEQYDMRFRRYVFDEEDPEEEDFELYEDEADGFNESYDEYEEHGFLNTVDLTAFDDDVLPF